MFKRLISAALIFGAAALAPPAQAQNRALCMSRDSLIETLEGRYAEALTGGGLQSAGQLLEVWSSADTGSFTVFITYPNGMSCIMASGENWHNAATQASGDVAG